MTAISVPPSRQCQSNWKEQHHLLNSGLRFLFRHFKGRNPKLWPTQTHTVVDVRPPPTSNSRPFFYEDADELHLHGKKHKHVEKSASRFQLCHECLHNLICPCMMFVSVFCEDVHRLRWPGPQEPSRVLVLTGRNYPLNYLLLLFAGFIRRYCLPSFYCYENSFNSAY